MQKPKLAARRLLEAHERREPFAPLPPELAPRTAEEAYAIQDCFVALRAERLGAIGGGKKAPSSEGGQEVVWGGEAPARGGVAGTPHGTPAPKTAEGYPRPLL